MSLRDAVEGAVANYRKYTGPPCSVCALPAAEKQALRELRAAGLSFPAMAKLARAEGHPTLTFGKIGHHFREHEPQR